MKISLSILTLIFTLNCHAIYEDDDRIDFYKLQDPKLKEISNAMAFQIYFDELKGWTFNRYWEILTSPLAGRGVCQNERFSNQPVMRNDCSGILVGPKHLLMPGNCITDHYCKNDLFYYMFNYQMDSSDPLDVKRHKKFFYKCEKLLKRVYDPNSALSYALLELDKTVEGVTPVKLSKSEKIPEQDELIAFGHPAGMPLKIANNAFVTDQNEKHFLVSSDIAGSSKGAAIINAKTLELEGMLIGGSKEYENSPDGCKRTPVLPFSESKELAIKIQALNLPL